MESLSAGIPRLLQRPQRSQWETLLPLPFWSRGEFRQETLHSFHPAGSLGKKLFVRVKDPDAQGRSPAVDRIVYAGNGSIDGDII